MKVANCMRCNKTAKWVGVTTLIEWTCEKHKLTLNKFYIYEIIPIGEWFKRCPKTKEEHQKVPPHVGCEVMGGDLFWGMNRK